EQVIALRVVLLDNTDGLAAGIKDRCPLSELLIAGVATRPLPLILGHRAPPSCGILSPPLFDALHSLTTGLLTSSSSTIGTSITSPMSRTPPPRRGRSDPESAVSLTPAWPAPDTASSSAAAAG